MDDDGVASMIPPHAGREKAAGGFVEQQGKPASSLVARWNSASPASPERGARHSSLLIPRSQATARSRRHASRAHPRGARWLVGGAGTTAGRGGRQAKRSRVCYNAVLGFPSAQPASWKGKG